MKTSTKLSLASSVGFIAASVIVVVLVNHYMRQQALAEAESKALIVLNRNLATHGYFSHTLKPKVFELTDPYRPGDYFEPAWMSSTYAIREIDRIFRTLDPGDYYYKECAVNARSPQNEADAYERRFIEEMNADPGVRKRSEVRVIDGIPYFAVLVRGEILDESCMRCHSTPERAPGGLTERYGSRRSFSREVGQVVSAVSIRIPLSSAYAHANRISLQLSALLLTVLSFLFVIQVALNRRLVFRPLGRVQGKANEIAADTTRVGESIPEPGGSELGEMTRAFNKMSAELRRNVDNLEGLVSERTAQMENANRALSLDVAERERTAAELRAARDELEDRVRERTSELVMANEALEHEMSLRTEEESRYRRLAQQFDTLLNAIPDRIVLFSRDRKVLWANRVAMTEGGGAFGEGRYLHCFEPGFAGYAPCEPCPGLRSLETGSADNVQVMTRDQRIWDVRAFPIADEKGVPESVLVVSKDITERMRLQAEAVRSAKLAALGEMAAGVAHEINNPVNGIINYAQLIAEPDTGEKDREAFSREIIEEGQRIATIVRNLLSFARDSGRGRGLVSIGEVLDAALTLTAAQLRGDGVVIEVHRAPNLPPVNGNSQHLQQVFLNVINNARYALNQKYPRPDPRKVLEILCEASVVEGRPHVSVTFHDHGTGVPEPLLKRMTEPFFTTKPESLGTGLGLSISKGIIDDHGGRLSITSVEGQYTSVRVELPAGVTQ